MKQAQLIYVLGDIHGEFSQLNAFINKKIRMNSDVRNLANAVDVSGGELEVIFLQTGDFGFHWPGEDNSEAIKNRVGFAKDGLVKIYFCDGNHEDHDALDALERQHPGQAFIQVAPGIFFATFGAVLTLQDGSNVLFAGGAESCDIRDRIKGVDWWSQEGIDDRDMSRLPPSETKIDIVISHTSPHSFVHRGMFVTEKRKEQSRQRLELIFQAFRPTSWYYGHFHDFDYMPQDQGCRWVCLNHIGSGDTWNECISWPEVPPKPEKIVVVGDVHGMFSALYWHIVGKSPSLVLQCGDFGYWPNQGMKLAKNGFCDRAGNLVPVHFCDGNHENHPKLLELARKGKTEIAEGVHYQPRGSVLTLPDGRTVLFAGGAASIDRDARTDGVDWFAGEILTEFEFRTQFPSIDRVDIVISHTAPSSVVLPAQLEKKFFDPSRAVLEAVLHRYRPSLWCCAHFHIHFSQKLLDGECTLIALGCLAEFGGTIFLDDV